MDQQPWLKAICWALIGFAPWVNSVIAQAGDPASRPQARVDLAGPGWEALDGDDFAPVNGREETWQWKESKWVCSGKPIGVMRTRKQYRNFELLIQWRHLKPGGNSGVFAWVAPEALKTLEPGNLPRSGIEVQMLDPDFRRQYEERTGRKGDWFTTHGDIFAVGQSTLDPFPPLSPNGSRSFPTKELTREAGNWNQYYVRGINGEIRLWVNGQEVSGGSNAEPQMGYLCLEAEGSPIEFKNIYVREVP